ncbi:hypothetical protein PPL_05688 [Heterostelium album PN500]|uniref:Thioredoxin domain-containing protein n=1 Tax=Heterostelium pallidum (strain ATCC 26659 / Pp 5 / PN500) TaxID=670386 RepID=D3BAV7_HETP5|nr:hypothetical protein PPL_05688 [Heterostelium album PN500]EFA81694.1 hypothetical protein PPL_05688 [Heterostelium album PN500]|eukprot:XP_020433811.1 hypothetical protein PPL_05688 [Heterostelium album PN500]
MDIKSIVGQLKQPYYILNFSIVFSFILLRCLGVVERSSSERLTIYYTLFAILIKTVKSRVIKSVDFVLTSALFIIKLSILYLLYAVDNYYLFITYLLSFIVSYILYSQPVYQIPSSSDLKVTYFNPITLSNTLSNHSVKDDGDKDDNQYLIVTFFALWSPVCTYLAPTFISLANKYGNDRIQFGKVDIGRWKPLTLKHNIDDSVKSNQIPTIILFKNGVEHKRIPTIDKSTAFTLKENELIDYFNLDQLQTETKQSRKKPSSTKSITYSKSSKNKKD